jgi:hypothetical protein
VTRNYASPASFRNALEQRLRNSAKSGYEFTNALTLDRWRRAIRKRQLLVFDRFLARIGAVFGERVTLNGGLVLELRLEHARATKDVDLRLVGSPENLLQQLQEAGQLSLGDFMEFQGRAPNIRDGPSGTGTRCAGSRRPELPPRRSRPAQGIAEPVVTGRTR